MKSVLFHLFVIDTTVYFLFNFFVHINIYVTVGIEQILREDQQFFQYQLIIIM